MNGRGDAAGRLRARVRAALAGGDLEPVVSDLLELRFPADGPGARLDEAGAALGMSAALVAHIEFGALCAIAARRSPARAATTTTGGSARGAGRLRDEGGRA
ncbi:MAG: hypothetical protein AB7I38_15140 [Dehalococcoidia bacterium]